MSLEQALAENTAALKAFTAALQASTPVYATLEATTEGSEEAGKPRRGRPPKNSTAPAPTAAPAQTTSDSSGTPAAAPSAPSAPAATPATAPAASSTDPKKAYEEMRAALLEASKDPKLGGRKLVETILQRVGAKTVPDVKPDLFATVHQLIAEARAGKDPAAAIAEDEDTLFG